MSKKDELIKRTNKLFEEGKSLIVEFNKYNNSDVPHKLMLPYQIWYTEAYEIVKQIIPDRVQEFKEQYEPLTTREEVYDINYTIRDFLIGLRVKVGRKDAFDCQYIAYVKFVQQIAILKSAQSLLESSLNEMEGLLQAELYDTEISKARELHKGNYIREAGVIAGVVLEGHLKSICEKHNITMKKNSSLSDYNEELKKNDVIDLTKWRMIQWLGDIRNLCAHKKERNPTQEEVLELIDGVDKSIKTIF